MKPVVPANQLSTTRNKLRHGINYNERIASDADIYFVIRHRQGRKLQELRAGIGIVNRQYDNYKEDQQRRPRAKQPTRVAKQVYLQENQGLQRRHQGTRSLYS